MASYAGQTRSHSVPRGRIDYLIDAQDRRIGKRLDGQLIQGEIGGHDTNRWNLGTQYSFFLFLAASFLGHQIASGQFRYPLDKSLLAQRTFIALAVGRKQHLTQT